MLSNQLQHLKMFVVFVKNGETTKIADGMKK